MDQQLDLERCGFCSRDAGLSHKYNFDAQGIAIIALKNNLGFVIEGDTNGHVTFNALVLSRAGVDLFNINDSISDVQKLADFALAQQSVKRCFYGPMTQLDDRVQIAKEPAIRISSARNPLKMRRKRR